MLTPRDDLYPSRFGTQTHWLPRQDPVVHGAREHMIAAGWQAADIDAFERDGFVVWHDVFNDAELETLQAEAQRMRTDATLCATPAAITETDGQALRSLFHIHATQALWRRVASDERLAGRARALLGDEVYIHQSRLNDKPAFHGQAFDWHSDFETWHTEDGMPRMRAVSMSVTLTPNHAQNGPLMLIPGSHRHYITCVGDTPPEHFKQSLKRQDIGVPAPEVVTQLVNASGLVTVEAPPGSVIVFDCNTLHGSNGNITPWPRSNAFFVYNAMCNAVQDPYGAQAARPEFVASRAQISALQHVSCTAPGLTH